MSDQQKSSDTDLELATHPFLYEIRVKGRLSQEKWSSWFDNLTIAAEKGETVLRGTLQDHAALYGLLGRLRDLAVPLLSVNVLDAEAQRKLQAQSKRFNLLSNLLLILVYLLLLGGLITLTVFVTEVIHTALALAMLFAALGTLAYVFYLWSSRRFWLYASYVMWPTAMITFFIYTAVADLVHPALAIGMLLFLSAGGLIYLLYYIRNRAEHVDGLLGDWETLSQAESNDPDEESIDSLKNKGP